MSKFNNVDYEMLLLDELHPRNAIQMKKVLQSSVDVCTMGVSPTMQHSYEVLVHRVQIVISTNTWMNCEKMTDEDKEWLHLNCVYVEVDTKLWLD